MDARCGTVDRRAQAVPAEYVTKVRRLDHRFCSTLEGEVGPVERHLERFGAVRGVVFGHCAEGSTNAEAFLSHAARCGAERHWTRMRDSIKKILFTRQNSLGGKNIYNIGPFSGGS